MITAVFSKPVFTVDVPVGGVYKIPSCSKLLYERICMAAASGNSAQQTAAAAELCGEAPPPLSAACKALIEGYIDAVESYCDTNSDIYRIPSKPDFENDKPKVRLPILTLGESIVHEHTGLDFEAVNALDILDYRLLLADAVKLRILRRADGTGAEYLNECYNAMHRISNMFD